jgi:glycosyltransferase involved in cell wall biosynthesis
MISAYFSPLGGVGVQRILKFVKKLPNYNWNPIVVSIPIGSTKGTQDEKLLNKLPKNLKIYRPFYFDYRKIIPGEIAKLFKKKENKLLFPDKFQIWNYFLKRKLQKIIQDNNIEVIFINIPPFSTIDLTEFLSQNFHLPIALNFRDAFSFNNYYTLHSDSVRQERALAKEKKAFQFADKIICVTQYHHKKYIEIFPQFKGKFELITNGFDEQDFCFSPTFVKKEYMQIGYNGSVSSLVPLKPILDSIYEIYTKYQIKIVLNIATQNKKSKIRKIHPQCFDSGLVDFQGFLSHNASLNNINQTDLLLLMFANNTSTEGSYSGKVFEYFMIGKPILLLHRKNSVLAKLIKNTSTGVTINIDNHRSIIKYLLNAHKSWQNNKIAYNPNKHEIEKYNYNNLTQKLANLFNELIGESI